VGRSPHVINAQWKSPNVSKEVRADHRVGVLKGHDELKIR
jgi:hypothetical protein